MLTDDERELILSMIDFAEENWSAFQFRYEERTGEECAEEATTNLKLKLEEI